MEMQTNVEKLDLEMGRCGLRGQKEEVREGFALREDKSMRHIQYMP